MLKIIACDDDVAFLDRLHRMIDRWSSETGTAVDVALATRGEDLLARHAASRADIILLDMIMPLVNGMDTARELRQSDTAVRLVFLTSSPEFALESYEVRAFDYLLKPVAYERLAQLLDELSSMRPSATDELVINVFWLPCPAPVRHRICRGAQQARGLPPARRTRYRGARVVPQRRGPLGAKRGLL